MNRRDMIKNLAAGMGTVLSASTIAALVTACDNKQAPSAGSSQDQNANTDDLLATLSETILPRTDTPGARDAGVPQFITGVVTQVFSEDERKRFEQSTATFIKTAQRSLGMPFAQASERERVELVGALNRKHLSQRFNPATAGDQPDLAAEFVGTVKSLTLLGYYTSEAGATMELQYNAIPGAFHGCVPLEEVGKAWATPR